MNIQIVGEEEQKPVEVKQPETVAAVDEDLMLNSVGNMFDLRPNELQRFSDNLRTLIDYAKSQTTERSPEAIKWAIRSLQDRIGSPPLGQTWIPWLTQYAYLKLETLKMQKEVEKYERD